MNDAIVVAGALVVFAVVLLATLPLLALFVRRAAEALLALRDLREQTTETDDRRATVSAARQAVEDMRRQAYGESGAVDEELLATVKAEAAMNGRPYRVDDNEHRNYDEDDGEPSVPADSFYVPASEQ